MKHELPECVQKLLEVRYITKLFNKEPYKFRYEERANCWNATMLFHGAVQKVRYVEEGEAEQWLANKTRLVRPNFKGECRGLRFGDILSIWSNSYLGDYLEHTAVYIGQGKWFQKGGYRVDLPWEIVDFDTILADPNGGGTYCGMECRIHRVESR